jgi:hypothetical protein
MYANPLTLAQAVDQAIVASVEDDICARELALISILAAGKDGATEQAAITNLYGTLHVAIQGLGMRLPKFDYP